MKFEPTTIERFVLEWHFFAKSSKEKIRILLNKFKLQRILDQKIKW